MQTYAVESIPTEWPLMLMKVANGEEILLTEKEKPVAKLVPADNDDDYVRRMKALRGIVRGIDPTVERDEDTTSYRDRIRALRGFVHGIDTNVEAEDDPS